MKIIFDLDDTLVSFAESLCSFHNKRYGTNLKMNDFFSYDFTKVWGGTREEENKKIQQFFGSEEFLDMEVIDGAKEFISSLKDNELFIVTARPLYSEDVTKKQIEMHFEKDFSKIFHASFIYGLNGNTKSKKQICDEIGADVIIEDSADNANSLVNDNAMIFLFNRPWNRNAKTDMRIRRVDSWEQISQDLNFLIARNNIITSKN